MDASEDESPSFPGIILQVAVLGIVLFIIRRYFKGAQFTERVSGKDKVIVITGANSGIGFETVRQLNLWKAKVYMLCRSDIRATEAKIKLVKMGCDATRLIIQLCDMSSFESIRECAKAILKEEDHIDVLVNNAGVMFYPKYEKTVDGHEVTWQCNYLGPFMLTELLLPAIKRAANGRIVNVSSKVHLNSKPLDLSTIDDKKKFGLLDPYSRSKLANVMHARELTNRLRKEGTHNVTANSLHPGVVNTNLTRFTLLARTPLKQISFLARWFFLKTDRDGAQTSLYLALSKKVEGISGKYFSECKLASENRYALNDEACEDLFNYSLEQCGLHRS